MKNINFKITQAPKLWLGLYILIYCFPFPFNEIPYSYYYITRHIDIAKKKLSIWVGEFFFGLEDIEFIEINGSGDTLVDYLGVVAVGLIALVLTLITISLIKKKETIYRFYAGIIIYARYFVGLTLISYGVIKFLEGQFPSPSLLALETTYGESSPMGLAWRFFGYSYIYKGFMGASEVLAGFLLLFRRTAILGSLISIAVCTNIFLVNLSFDVPVKLFSGHLLLFSILIAAPSIKYLIKFFLLHQRTLIRPSVYRFDKKWKRVSYYSVKIFLVGLIPLGLIVGHVNSQSFYIYINEWEGVYQVDSFEIEGKPDLAFTAKWNKVLIQGKTIITINNAKTRSYYTIENIWNEGEINFVEDNEQEDPFTLRITPIDGEKTYRLETKIGDNVYQLETTRKIKEDYLLIKRGFNWVNERPFNR
ncbi:hypothetical protein MM239_13455 [Belliella sp. DSM 111904]|uniref:DoxX protein n=1 Tax=Belliella filtrata TaxID=2923435 RepID=A0ABS9V358_9BACT|nr:hypothetical protein [Belliella filtrata]MCH7410408.1 hypothetical protein [Belliella filtrata]